jgi:ribosomal protein S18 acetylase RimI-like enzyme
VIAGYAALGQSLPLASHSHVLQIRGLAVHPARQRCGVGRRLVEACIEQARSRGARKLSLRVLGANVAARRLYESCGFTVEGVLRVAPAGPGTPSAGGPRMQTLAMSSILAEEVTATA